MIINHNISALNTHRQLGANNNAVQSSLEKLSSGTKINRAGDDAAGLAISEKMRAQIRGLDMATKNAQDGISLIQTAEGALNETHAILQRMRELAVQAANDTNDEAVDRAALQLEIDDLVEELDRIATDTKFNGKELFDGEASFVIHVGADAGQSIDLEITQDMSSEGLGVNEIGLTEQTTADTAITTIQTAINDVSTARAELGAKQNRLEHTINNLSNASENLTAAESRIRDTDHAQVA
ncbi:MAG TPA: flagellin [Candidatus Pseudogracilibacillus intestinigallinarum]|uniref:Flagellin n=1 Tax=Candidatus Pseudogracilibacillus intestinigallinarum TaxID=2838742 RepID=A0A9D1PLK9_9BACI|nr:flagellin [Candidatus Pseudogracilibacillus intestinigallinarum]